jgi:sulfate/thiosulfate transport system substrate-binding protein
VTFQHGEAVPENLVGKTMASPRLSQFKLAQRWWVSSLVCLFIPLFLNVACRRQTDIAKQATVTVYGFSIVKEALEHDIFPAYQADWLSKTQQPLNFTSSFAGSEMVTNQLVLGVEADIGILANERNAQRLLDTKTTRSDWRKLPFGGIVNLTPMVILVRDQNPKAIRDFPDLAKPGVKVILADPTFSGGGQWALLAIFGSELFKTQQRTGKRDEQAAWNLMQKIWANVVATPDSARAARSLLEQGEGDVLVTYEIEALQLLDKKKPFQLIAPPVTVMCEHPVVLLDRGVTPAKYALLELFVRSLWDEPAQRAWVKNHFRSVNFDKLNDEHSKFSKFTRTFRVSELGGWERAYPEIIERGWKMRVQQNTK